MEGATAPLGKDDEPEIEKESAFSVNLGFRR